MTGQPSSRAQGRSLRRTWAIPSVSGAKQDTRKRAEHPQAPAVLNRHVRVSDGTCQEVNIYLIKRDQGKPRISRPAPSRIRTPAGGRLWVSPPPSLESPAASPCTTESPSPAAAPLAATAGIPV